MATRLNCPECDRTFIDQKTLDAHLRRVHGKGHDRRNENHGKDHPESDH